jgi:flagellar hook-length control protein FliK
VLPVASEVLSVGAPHAGRKPGAHPDSKNATPFAEMLNATSPNVDPTQPAVPPGQPQQVPATPEGDEASLIAALLAAVPGATVADPAATPAADSVDPAAQATDTTDAKPADTLPDGSELDAIAAAIANIIAAPETPDTPQKPKSKDGKGDEAGDEQSAKPQADNTVAAKTAPDTPVVAAIRVTAPAPPSAPTTPADQLPAGKAATLAIDILPSQPVSDSAKTATKDDPDLKPDGEKAKPATVAKADLPAVTTATLETAKTDGTKQTPNQQPDQPAPALSPNSATPSDQAAPASHPAQAPATEAQQAPAKHDARTSDALPAPKTPDKPADPLQPMVPVQTNAPTATAGTDRTAAAPAPATPPAVALPVAGIAVEIAGKALAGKNRFEIRLDPPELGHIHVRLDIDHDGQVTSHITADRSDTFDLLRRDAPALERALQDAGMKTANNGLQFSLRDHGFGRQQPMPQMHDSARLVVRDASLDADMITPAYRPVSALRAGVDIRV